LLAEAIRAANSVRSPPEYYARHGRGGGNTAVFQDLAADCRDTGPPSLAGFVFLGSNSWAHDSRLLIESARSQFPSTDFR
jgi:hypothetical protein